MKKILLSLSIIAFVGAIAIGATGAFFSDTETSSGNTFSAGAIDLGIDNTSYYNGQAHASTTWDIAYDLDDQNGPSNGAYLFFNFKDLKPGDYGEDTISIHVNNNDAWVCSDITVTNDKDNDCTEPENDADAENGACGDGDPNTNGDLADEIEIMWWADDGDNVFESDETIINQGHLGDVELWATTTVALADSINNIWTGQGNDPFPGATTKYVAKAWCFGNITAAGLAPSDYSGPDDPTNAGDASETTSEDGGFICDGAGVGNESQTDSVELDVSFTAEQARNNADFTCAQ